MNDMRYVCNFVGFFGVGWFGCELLFQTPSMLDIVVGFVLGVTAAIASFVSD